MQYLPYIKDPELETLCFFPMDTNKDEITSSTMLLGTTTFDSDSPVADLDTCLGFVDAVTSVSDSSGTIFPDLSGLEEGSLIIWYKLSGASIQPIIRFKDETSTELNMVRIFFSGSNRLHYEKYVNGIQTIDIQFCRHGGDTFTDNKWHSLVFTFTKTRVNIYTNSMLSYTIAENDGFFGNINVESAIFGHTYIEGVNRYLHGSLSCFSIHKKILDVTFIEDIIGMNKLSTTAPTTLYYEILKDLSPYIYYPLEDMLWETHRKHDIIYGQPTNGDPDFSESKLKIEEKPLYQDADERITIEPNKRIYSDSFNTTIMEADWSFLGYFSVYCTIVGQTYLVNIPADNGGDSSLVLFVNSSGFLECKLKLSDDSVITLGSDFTLDAGCGASVEEDNTTGPFQVLVSFDGTDYKMIINGEEKASVANALLLEQVSSELTIGGLTRTSTHGTYYMGVSSVAFFKTAVTAEDLKSTIVTSGEYDKIILADFPVAYYRLDEAY